MMGITSVTGHDFVMLSNFLTDRANVSYAQRLDLGFPLRLALSVKRREVARLIRKDDGWVPPDDEHGGDSKPSAIPRKPGICAAGHALREVEMQLSCFKHHYT
jgi:hypothetical protein